MHYLLILVITFNFRVLPAIFGGAQKCLLSSFLFFRQAEVPGVEYFFFRAGQKWSLFGMNSKIHHFSHQFNLIGWSKK